MHSHEHTASRRKRGSSNSVLRAVVYISHARAELSDADIDQLLTRAQRFNRQHGVTGVLLYSGTNFFQYFEGRPIEVCRVYERIRQSPLHYGILELMHGPIPKRCFAEWHMGFGEVPQTKLTSLAQAHWIEELVHLEKTNCGCPGVEMLLEYWTRGESLTI